MAVFSIQDLTFSYPSAQHPAICGIDLTVNSGDYVALCGKSGCGKTTLLRHLKTVLTPVGQSKGVVLFEGVPLDQVSQRNQAGKIGFVMQNPDAQIVTDKVWHELAFGLESLGCDQRTMRLRVAEMASYFGIQNWFHEDVRNLSGGQKQLLNLASVMAMQPEVLILDEPTGQLDPLAATDFLNTVRKINRDVGTTVIMTEHRLEEVFPAADRVMVMESGRIIADDEPRKVGDWLHANGNDMLSALPTPLRIYYALTSSVSSNSAASGINSDGTASSGSVGDSTNESAPLTVREGRVWLSREYGQKAEEARAQAPASLPMSQAADAATPVADGMDAFERRILQGCEAAVEMKDVWLRYDRDAADVLRDVNLQIPEGGIHAIMGGNGAGKSTLLKAMCGVTRPYRGTIRVFGKKLKDWKPGQLFGGCMAMLPQDPQNLFVKKTVRADLEEMLVSSMDAGEKDARIDRIVRQTGIESFLQTHPFDLSGGELQRAALAKVLLSSPRILLLDEPTKGIDGFFKEALAELLGDLAREGRTILMVTHDIEFCARYADIVGMMFDGSIVSSAVPQAFFSQNSFYTTAANRMSRHLFSWAVTDEDVIGACAKIS